MGRAKEIIVKVIPAKIANEFVKKHHYSGSFAPTAQIHFGCFLDGKMHGAMSFGASIDKRNTIGFVDTGLSENEGWNSFLEINRIAFDDYLPKNSESRCIAMAIRLIKKNAPHVKWILSYADGTQCGDGTIYRASGFKLCGITTNRHIVETPDGKVLVKHGSKKADFSKTKIKEGFQLKYIYLIDKTCKINLPIIPFEKIDEVGAGIYKGKKISLRERRDSLSERVDLNASSQMDSEGATITLLSHDNINIEKK